MLGRKTVQMLTTLLLLLAPMGVWAAGGGGGGEHAGESSLVVPLGMMLLGATVLAILLSYVKQSSLLAFIGVGAIGGFYAKSIGAGDELISKELMTAFIDIGIILLLFMAGMEVDLKGMIKRWKLVLINGVGQIGLLFVVSLGLGIAYIGIGAESFGDGWMASAIYFALCLTLSSTILVIGTLKKTGQMETMHGQIALGLMVLQDVVAVVSLAILVSLDPNKTGGGSLGLEVGMIFLKMAILVVILYFITKYILNPMFKYLARSSELLFVGALGYGLGIGGLCEVVSFSSGIGAFFAGATLAALPYRHEIEDKVEPLKSFGVILFFIALGFDLPFLDGAAIVAGLGQGIVLTLFLVILTVPLMLLLGYLAKMKGRASFMIGAIINQSSEFSLMLAVICREFGIFNDELFIVVTLVVLLTFFLSSLGHQFLEPMYQALRARLMFIDTHALAEEEEHEELELENHVVILSFNDLAMEIADFYAQHGQKVLLLDLDPDITDYFKKNKQSSNIIAKYADMQDPDVWEHYAFENARVVISCMDEGQEAEIAICHYLHEKSDHVPFLAATSSHEEALELYEAGVRYAIQTEYLASKSFRDIFATEMEKDPKEAFRQIGQEHQEATKQLKEEAGILA
jgi:Kef-type K+ transport system membrane component KefB